MECSFIHKFDLESMSLYVDMICLCVRRFDFGQNLVCIPCFDCCAQLRDGEVGIHDDVSRFG